MQTESFTMSREGQLTLLTFTPISTSLPKPALIRFEVTKQGFIAYQDLKPIAFALKGFSFAEANGKPISTYFVDLCFVRSTNRTRYLDNVCFEFEVRELQPSTRIAKQDELLSRAKAFVLEKFNGKGGVA